MEDNLSDLHVRIRYMLCSINKPYMTKSYVERDVYKHYKGHHSC